MKEAEKGAGYEARSALVERIRHAKVIALHAVKRGKYFRLVAEVIADGEKLSALSVRRWEGSEGGGATGFALDSGYWGGG